MSLKNRLNKLEQRHDITPRYYPPLPDETLAKLALMPTRDIKAEIRAILNDPNASQADKERARRGIAPIRDDKRIMKLFKDMK